MVPLTIIIVDDLEKTYRIRHDYNSWKRLLVESPHELLACGIGTDGHIVGFTSYIQCK